MVYVCRLAGQDLLASADVNATLPVALENARQLGSRLGHRIFPLEFSAFDQIRWRMARRLSKSSVPR